MNRQSRGLGVTSSHLYIGSQVNTSNPFFGAGPIGHVLILPIGEIEGVKTYPPQILWSAETILAASPEETDSILINGVTEKTLYIKSSQTGTAVIKMYNEVTQSYEEIENYSVTANVLDEHDITYNGRAIKLRFEPSSDASVSSWIVLISG